MMRVVPCVLSAERPWSRSAGRAYTPAQARALFELAESRPTPEQYERERARILGRS